MSIERREAPHELRLDLPAAHSAGRMARSMAREFALAEGVTEEAVQTLEFVIGELLDNAVDHGGGGAARDEADLTEDVRVRLELSVEGQLWTARVEDQGGGDPAALARSVAGKDGLPDLDDERGRGFFLLLSMVRRLEFEASRDGRGIAVIAFGGLA